MKRKLLSANTLLWLGMSFLPLLIAQSVQAQVKQNQQTAIQSGSITVTTNSSTTNKRIKRLSEMERPSTNASELLSQSSTPQAAPSSEVVQVTGVKANPTNKGVEVILQTTRGQALQLENRTIANSNSFIADILNAQLRLASGKAFTFRSDKPIAGITEITVTNFDAKTIRVTVIGSAGAPIVELYESPKEGLIFSVASAAGATQQPQQPQTQQTPQSSQPESQTQPTQPSASGDEPIELVVTGQQDGYSAPNATTATRTDTPLRDIPQSIQVIPQEIIKDQQAIRVTDAVRNVSGVQEGSTFGGTRDSFIIRGFQQRVLFRDGFRDYAFRTIIRETANLGRIEVLKGPASVLFGTLEPGGIINLVTKQPLSEPFFN